jgi:hypothetical protein
MEIFIFILADIICQISWIIQFIFPLWEQQHKTIVSSLNVYEFSGNYIYLRKNLNGYRIFFILVKIIPMICRFYIAHLVMDLYKEDPYAEVICGINVCLLFLHFTDTDCNFIHYVHVINVIEFMGYLYIWPKSFNQLVRDICGTYLFFCALIFICYLLSFVSTQYIKDTYGVIMTFNYDNKIIYEQKSFVDHPQEDKICNICFESYEENPDYYLLSCKHYAHVECLDSWWKTIDDKKCYYSCKQK